MASTRFDIDSYKANFTGGSRQYLFYYKPMFPTSIAIEGANTDVATYLVRATTLPETVTEEIMLNWQGFDFKFPGKYTYSDWTVTFNVDLESTILRMFNSWAQQMHDPTTNFYKDPVSCMSDQHIDLLGLEGEPITRYTLTGAWPKSVGTATLDYSANDVLQFDVTFTYIYHAADNIAYGNPPQSGR